MPVAVEGDGVDEAIDEILLLGAGPHQAEVPLENVPQLGNLVDAEAAQHPAHPGQTLVVGGGEAGTVLLGPVDHRPELVEREQLAVVADSLLFEDHRPLRVHLDGEPDDPAHDQPQRRRGHDCQEVGRPLEEGVVGVARHRLGDLPALGQVHHRQAPGVLFVDVGQRPDGDAGQVARRHPLRHRIAEDRSQVDDQQGVGRKGLVGRQRGRVVDRQHVGVLGGVEVVRQAFLGGDQDHGLQPRLPYPPPEPVRQRSHEPHPGGDAQDGSREVGAGHQEPHRGEEQGGGDDGHRPPVGRPGHAGQPHAHRGVGGDERPAGQHPDHRPDGLPRRDVGAPERSRPEHRRGSYE